MNNNVIDSNRRSRLIRNSSVIIGTIYFCGAYIYGLIGNTLQLILWGIASGALYSGALALHDQMKPEPPRRHRR